MLCTYYVENNTISPLLARIPVLVCVQGSAALYKVSDTLHVTAVVSSYLHGDATTCHRIVIERTRKVVSKNSVYCV